MFKNQYFYSPNNTSGGLAVDNVWVYTPDGSPKQIKIWFTHKWVVYQLSMLWFMQSSEVRPN